MGCFGQQSSIEDCQSFVGAKLELPYNYGRSKTITKAVACHDSNNCCNPPGYKVPCIFCSLPPSLTCSSGGCGPPPPKTAPICPKNLTWPRFSTHRATFCQNPGQRRVCPVESARLFRLSPICRPAGRHLLPHRPAACLDCQNQLQPGHAGL